MSTQSILVPTDLSEASDKALEYAKVFAKSFNLPISLMHVVEISGTEDFVAKKYLTNNFVTREMKKQLDDIAANALRHDNIVVNPMVVEGNIFDAIGKTAVDCNAKFIVLATHGVRGVQHISGAFISKVLQNCKAPAMIVQKDSSNPLFEDVILPCDVTGINLGDDLKLTLIKNSGAKVHVLYPANREEFILYTPSLNETAITKLFKENDINCIIHKVEGWSGNTYSEKILSYADKVQASLIFLNRKGNVINKEDEQLITNSHCIPVFIS